MKISSLDDYQKPVDNLKKDDFFSRIKNAYPSHKEIERTKKIIELFNSKNGETTKLNLKSDVNWLTCVFEKFIKISIEKLDVNLLYCVSLAGYTSQCGLKNISVNLQTLQDKDTILLPENIIRGGISSVMGYRYLKSEDNKKITFIDSNKLYGHLMSQPLPYDEIIFDTNVRLQDNLKTPDDSDIGYFVEVELSYPDNIKKKTNFSFAPEKKKIDSDDFTSHMNENKPKTYTQNKKLKCDWTNKKKYFIHNRMLKFYVRHGLVADKVHDIISFKQSKWLEKYEFPYTKNKSG